jgi:hypothetical protein
MNARRIGGLAALVTLIASGTYFFLYLYRWEWNRAQVAGAIFVATEVGLVGWLLSDRLRRVERRLDTVSGAVSSALSGASGASGPARDRRLHVLRETRPDPRVNFAWLARTDRSSVFIPVLLGAGAVMSGLAWVVERLSRATAGRVGERGLASRLGALEPPSTGLLAVDHDPLAVLRGPARAGARP